MPQIFPLSEGEFTIGHDKMFVPFNEAHDVLTERSVGSLLVEVQPFLVITAEDVLLLDTGLGFHTQDGQLQLHKNLAQHGFQPADVTKVLMSHLHKDHAGGVIYTDMDGAVKPTCPNAGYFIYRPEADFALATGYPSYHPAALEPLFASGQVQWLEGERGAIGNAIRWQHSGAHCPQHIIFWIEEEGRKIFFGGDEAPQLKQMKMKYVAKYDYDGRKAMELRAQWAEAGKREGSMFLFYHDVKCPVATV